jgi:hypothetical protein
MITTITKGKKEFKVITQQYVVGLYCAVYEQGKSMPAQMNLPTQDEKGFHTDVRQGKFFKGKIKVVDTESTPL